MRLALFLLLQLVVPATAAELTLTIEPRWGGTTVAVPSETLTNTAGQSLRLTRFTALMSGVALVRGDGSVVRLDGQYGLIDAAAKRLAVTLQSVPEGNYVGLEFQLGVPPVVNHADPGGWPAGHALNPLLNGLHWNWQGGYVFLALEGHWRTAEKMERGFSYHLAMDARLMTVRFRADFRVERATTVALALDLRKIAGSHRLAANDGSESTHSRANDERAASLAAKAERAWFWLEAKPGGGGTRERVESKEVPVGQDASGPGTTPWAFTVPAGFPQPSLPVDNPLTVEGVRVGERLFRDRRLSGNGGQSCANCHEPARAFSSAVPLSRGTDGTRGRRNALPLFNLAWNPAFAWDGAKPRIRDQSLAAMMNPIEMHAVPATVVAQLSRDPRVTRDFAAAFGTPEITAERIGLALEQYLLTIVSADSKFDRARRGAAELTEEEKEGFALFLTEYDPTHGLRGADCFHCHGGALFSDYGFKNNGLERVSGDAGYSLVTGREADRGKFKVPSLRNVAVTAPYMHDGRMRTLEDVVAHYDHGVRRAANLDPNIAKHPEAGLQLTAPEQRALVAFLRTLTDPQFTNPPRRPPPPPPLRT